MMSQARRDLVCADDYLRAEAHAWVHSPCFRRLLEALADVFDMNLNIDGWPGVGTLRLFGSYKSAKEAEGIRNILEAAGVKAVRIHRRVYVETTGDLP